MRDEHIEFVCVRNFGQGIVNEFNLTQQTGLDLQAVFRCHVTAYHPQSALYVRGVFAPIVLPNTVYANHQQQNRGNDQADEEKYIPVHRFLPGSYKSSRNKIPRVRSLCSNLGLIPVAKNRPSTVPAAFTPVWSNLNILGNRFLLAFTTL